jgi:hypothetical protein
VYQASDLQNDLQLAGKRPPRRLRGLQIRQKPSQRARKSDLPRSDRAVTADTGEENQAKPFQKTDAQITWEKAHIDQLERERKILDTHRPLPMVTPGPSHTPIGWSLMEPSAPTGPLLAQEQDSNKLLQVSRKIAEEQYSTKTHQVLSGITTQEKDSTFGHLPSRMMFHYDKISSKPRFHNYYKPDGMEHIATESQPNATGNDALDHRTLLELRNRERLRRQPLENRDHQHLMSSDFFNAKPAEAHHLKAPAPTQEL